MSRNPMPALRENTSASRPGRSQRGAGTGTSPGQAAIPGGRAGGRDSGDPGPGGGRGLAPLPGRGQDAARKGLSGQDFRDEMRRALSGRAGTRHPRTPRALAGKKAIPAPVPPAGGVTLTATAHCLRGCDWTEGPGSMTEVDRAAARHTEKPPKHPTSVLAEPAGGAA